MYNPSFANTAKGKERERETSLVLQVACGDDFSFVLTQSGKLYSWGLFDDGRLGVRKAFGGVMHNNKNSFTYEPQRVQFTDDHIEEIHADGSIAYCKVSGINDLEKFDIPKDKKEAGSIYSNRTYIWGKVPKGLKMNRQASVFPVPQLFNEI
jgi:hypothetical protein